MTDDLDPLRRLRPDEMLPADPPDLDVLASERRRLLTDITGTFPDVAQPMPSIYPRLAYRDEQAALEFLVRVFGLVERREARMEHPDGMLAWLELGNGVIMIGRAGPDRHGLASPAETGAPTAMVNAYVDDVDAHYRRAAAEGARVLNEPEDMFWGDRRYEVLDLDGHRWHFAQRRRDQTTGLRSQPERIVHMSDSFVVRPPRADDFAAWRPLWAGYNEFYGRSGATALADEITEITWARFFDADEPVHALVAEINGELVGLAHYLFHRTTISPAPLCYLQDLFTVETARRTGIGRALIDAVYAAARGAGSTRVYWHTQGTNATARRLYDQVAEYSGFIVYRNDV